MERDDAAAGVDQDLRECAVTHAPYFRALRTCARRPSCHPLARSSNRLLTRSAANPVPVQNPPDLDTMEGGHLEMAVASMCIGDMMPPFNECENTARPCSAIHDNWWFRYDSLADP